MTALSIVEDALNGIAAKTGCDALHIVEDALASYEKRGSLVQDEFAFDETPQETEGGVAAEGDGSEPDEGEGLDLPDGVKVEKEGDDSVKFTFKFKYAPNKYDSTVDDGAKQGNDTEMKSGDSDGGADGVDEQIEEQEDLQVKVAEDALPPPAENAVAHASAQCKATFEECKAKNPYACKYHGQKLMESDLYALLAQNGAKTAKVELTEEKGVKGSFNAVVTCIDTPAEKKAAAKAIKAFLKKQGIDPESVIDFGYDKEEKSHSAFFDVDDLDKGAKSDDEMHKEQKEEPKQNPEEKKEEPAEEKKEESPKEEVKAEAVEETEQTSGGAGKHDDEEEVQEEVKETSTAEPEEAISESAPFTDEELISALKGSFPENAYFTTMQTDDGLFDMFKKAISEGIGSDGKPLNSTNQKHLQELLDKLPADNPVAKQISATLAKLNAAKGEEATAKPEGGKPKKAKKAKKGSEPQAAETQSLEVSTEGGTSGTEPDGSAKYAEMTDAFNAALKKCKDSGAENNEDCKAAIKKCEDELEGFKAASEILEDCNSALAALKADDKMSEAAKKVKEGIMKKTQWESLQVSSGAEQNFHEALKKLDAAVGKHNAAKVSKAKDAVKAVEEEVKGTFPYAHGLIKTSAISEAYSATEDFKDECANYGIDADQLGGTENLGLKATNLKISATAYSNALKDFAKVANSGDSDARKVEEQAQKVAAAGKELLSSYKLLELAKEQASQSLQAKVKENQDAEAAKAAQTQTSAPSASAAPTDKKAAVKAKIAAMTPKEKAAKAIEILKKKIAADPSNAENKAKLAKFEALAAKLG